jgi:hypothetical protein
MTLLGIGRRELFSPEVARTALQRMRDIAKADNDPVILLPLPGRPENACTSSAAMDGFMDSLNSHAYHGIVILIDTPGAQQIMLRILERRQFQNTLGMGSVSAGVKNVE